MSNEIKQPIMAGGMYEVTTGDGWRPAMILVLSVEQSQYNLNIVRLRYLDHAGVVQCAYFCIDDLQRAATPAALESVAVDLTESIAIDLTVSGCK